MTSGDNSTKLAVVQRLFEAMNDHDLDALGRCFAPDVRSEQPFHPDRAFRGRERVRKNWAAIFQHVPDFRAELCRSASAGEEVWIELYGHGTRIQDGEQVEARGVMILGIRGEEITWSRVFTEPVHHRRSGLSDMVKELYHRQSRRARVPAR